MSHLILAYFSIFLFFIFTFAVCGAIVAYFAPAIHGAPFVQTKNTALETMLHLAQIKPGEKVADLGSGDGKIVIELAKHGIEAHGFEINPILVFQSRWAIRRAHLEKKAFIHWKNFWKQDLSSFNIIMLYGIPYIMEKLEEKLKKELNPKTRIVSNTFTFPNWKESERKEKIHLYIQ